MADPQKKSKKFRIKWWWDSEDEQAAKADPQYAEALEKADDVIKEQDLDKSEVEQKKGDIIKKAIKETEKESKGDAKKTSASAGDEGARPSAQEGGKDSKGLFHSWFGDDGAGQDDSKSRKEGPEQRGGASNKGKAAGGQPADQKNSSAKDTLAGSDPQGRNKDKHAGDNSLFKGWLGSKQPENGEDSQKEPSKNTGQRPAEQHSKNLQRQKPAEHSKKADQHASEADKSKGFWNWGKGGDEEHRGEVAAQTDGSKQEGRRIDEPKRGAMRDGETGRDKAAEQKRAPDGRPGSKEADRSELSRSKDADRGRLDKSGKDSNGLDRGREAEKKPDRDRVDKGEKQKDADKKSSERDGDRKDKEERTNTLLVICGCINVVLAVLFFLYTEVWADATVTYNMLLVGLLLLVILVPFILLPLYRNLVCRVLAVISVVATIALLVYLFINRARVYYFQLPVRSADLPQFENIERMYWSERNPDLFSILRSEGYYIEEWAESSKRKGAKIFILKGKLVGTDKVWEYDRGFAEKTLRENIEKNTDESRPAVAYSLVRVSWTKDRAVEILREIGKTKFSKLGENYVFVIGVFDIETDFGDILGSEPVSVDAISGDQSGAEAGSKITREFNNKI